MHKEAREELDVRFKLIVLDLAEQFGVTKTCRDFKVPRSSFYRWKKKYDQEGPSGLYRKKPIAHTHPRKTPPEIVEKILELRREYQIGALRIKYYLERYPGINISEATISRTLKAYNLQPCLVLQQSGSCEEDRGDVPTDGITDGIPLETLYISG